MAAPSIDPRLAEVRAARGHAAAERRPGDDARDAVHASGSVRDRHGDASAARHLPAHRGRPLGDLATHPDVLATVGDVSGIASSRPSECTSSPASARPRQRSPRRRSGTAASQTCDLSRLGPGEIRASRSSRRSRTWPTSASSCSRKRCWRARRSPRALLEAHGGHAALAPPVRQAGGGQGRGEQGGYRTRGALVGRLRVFDEFPRMNGEEDGVVNFDDARRAVIGRMLPGAQLFGIEIAMGTARPGVRGSAGALAQAKADDPRRHPGAGR